MVMSENTQDDRLVILKELPPLLPQFLLRRRIGAPVVPALMEEFGLDRMSFFILPQVQQVIGSSGGEQVTLAQIRSYFPYHVIDPFTPGVALLKEKGLLEGDEIEGLSLSARGRGAIERLHTEAKEHVSRIKALPTEQAKSLADQLESAVETITSDPVLEPRPGSHLAGSRSVAGIGNIEPAMVRIEQAVYDLWMTRDDAHMKAWRNAEMEGPAMSVWTLLWNGDATTVDELAAKLVMQLTKADIESNLAYLFEKEYVIREADTLQLTPEGILAREDIERETDRIYFAPWPHSVSEAGWMRDRLQVVVDKLPSPPA